MSGTISLNLKRAAVVVALALVLVAVLLRNDTKVGAISATGSPISGICKGAKQGTIKGDSIQKGREGTYSISALTHGITSPRDAASGLPTGRRQHKPIRFTAPVSAATPKFILALAQNELMTCTFKGFKTDPRTGAEKKAWEITLDGASVADYEMSGRPGGADTMTLSLTYQKITWTWADGGITVQDDWATAGD